MLSIIHSCDLVTPIYNFVEIHVSDAKVNNAEMILDCLVRAGLLARRMRCAGVHDFAAGAIP